MQDSKKAVHIEKKRLYNIYPNLGYLEDFPVQ